jgi:hypothetical protein
MASIGALLSPVKPGTGGCPGANWYAPSTLGACPGKLVIEGDFSSLITMNCAVSFNGGTKVSSACLTTSASYVQETFNDLRFEIDVWAAYRAGAWTSSVTVAIYANVLFSGTTFVRAGKLSSLNDLVTKSLASVPFGWPACPTVQVATVTVTDAGVLTIA